MAKVLRWRVLANRKFTVRETDLILGGESLINLATLMRESMRKPLTFAVCASWVSPSMLLLVSVLKPGVLFLFLPLAFDTSTSY